MDISFIKKGYVKIPKMITSQTSELLYINFKLLESITCCEQNKSPHDFHFNDTQVQNCFSYYASLGGDAVCLQLLPLIEKEINIELLPTYSYMRIYYKGSILEKHTDRDECEISSTICIKTKGEPWKMNLIDKLGNEVEITLEEGDVLIYNGCLEHWRNEYSGIEQTQLFLHYVNANGPNRGLLFDRRKQMGINGGTK
jgi:hypothetical protein